MKTVIVLAQKTSYVCVCRFYTHLKFSRIFLNCVKSSFTSYVVFSFIQFLRNIIPPSPHLSPSINFSFIFYLAKYFSRRISSYYRLNQRRKFFCIHKGIMFSLPRYHSMKIHPCILFLSKTSETFFLCYPNVLYCQHPNLTFISFPFVLIP